MKISAMALGDYQTNCYFVWDEATMECAVIDPGYDAPTILNYLGEQALQCKVILLTHAHFDHIGAVAALQQATGCRVYVHKNELSLPPELMGAPLQPTDYYDEGSTVTLGAITFQVLLTPGHTPGSVCLIAGDVLFSGDTLFAGSCGRTDFAGGSWDAMEASLRRLAQLPGDDTVLPGHGGSTTLARERKTNMFLFQALQG
ncbi:MAG: MBL fold metallo-hydrolase [Oscillospiraceae bacterium]|nr:MBL fold metallo-hydrolase [Oscillospiraceae bacterium]